MAQAHLHADAKSIVGLPGGPGHDGPPITAMPPRRVTVFTMGPSVFPQVLIE